MQSNLKRKANAPKTEDASRHWPSLGDLPPQGNQDATALPPRPGNQAKFNAGLVFVLARALQRHSSEHIAVEQAAYWLRSHGFERHADQLGEQTGSRSGDLTRNNTRGTKHHG
jgi:hypothetical protein